MRVPLQGTAAVAIPQVRGRILTADNKLSYNPPVREFIVSTAGKEPQYVHAENWLSALGAGIAAYGLDPDMQRLACERLHNGAVIARDVSNGLGFIVRPAPPKEEPDVAIEDDVDEEEEYEILVTMTNPQALDKHGRLNTLIDQIASAPTIGAAWNAAANVTHDLVACETAIAFEWDEDGSLYAVAIAGKSQGLNVDNLSVPAGIGCTGLALETTRTVIVADPKNDPRLSNPDQSVIDRRARSLLAVPIGQEGQIYGCLVLLDAPVTSPFDTVKAGNAELAAGVLAARLSRTRVID